MAHAVRSRHLGLQPLESHLRARGGAHALRGGLRHPPRAVPENRALLAGRELVPGPVDVRLPPRVLPPAVAVRGLPIRRGLGLRRRAPRDHSLYAGPAPAARLRPGPAAPAAGPARHLAVRCGAAHPQQLAGRIAGAQSAADPGCLLLGPAGGPAKPVLHVPHRRRHLRHNHGLYPGRTGLPRAGEFLHAAGASFPGHLRVPVYHRELSVQHTQSAQPAGGRRARPQAVGLASQKGLLKGPLKFTILHPQCQYWALRTHGSSNLWKFGRGLQAQCRRQGQIIYQSV
mmetsp:Transcript_20582/g.45792  ORF Transcript_20582/g.45792 Transcript_20582/m.45792 type:complete len:286 (+) Transcript_20582:925-1782(+)